MSDRPNATAMCWSRCGVAAAVLVTVLTSASAAFALDGYHDRRGLYGGVTVNGAFASGILNETAGGFGVGLQLGGGASDWVTLGAALDLYWFPSETVGEPVVFRPAIQAMFFFPPGLFVDLSAGLAWWNFRGGDNLPLKNDSDTGFSAAAGIGYEFWIAAAQALSITAAYDFTYLPDLDEPTHLVTAKIGFRWY